MFVGTGYQLEQVDFKHMGVAGDSRLLNSFCLSLVPGELSSSQMLNQMLRSTSSIYQQRDPDITP